MDALQIINNIRQQLDALEAQLKQMPAAKPTGTSLATLNLSTRARRWLERVLNITTVEEALALDTDTLKRVPRIREAVLREIKEELETRRQTLYKEELEGMKQ